jgi:hypothetical protein
MSEVHAVEMPALDGRLPLSFLASLGLLVVLDELEPGTRLSFSKVSGAAVIHSPLRTLDEVAEVLAAQAAAADEEASIAGVAPGFPLGGGAGDPMRLTCEGYRALAGKMAEADPAAAAWLPHLVTDLALDDRERGIVTPFSAQDRNEGLAEFFRGPLAAVRREPERISEALRSWRRVPGTKALMLDDQAMWYAADDAAGQRGQERGVPGAIWLATMSLRLMRLTGDGHSAHGTLWHRAGGRQVMLWPLWRQPLGKHGAQALIEHPAIVPVTPADSEQGAAEVTVRNSGWRCLGILGVYGAQRVRAPGQKSQRVLTPVPVRVID